MLAMAALLSGRGFSRSRRQSWSGASGQPGIDAKELQKIFLAAGQVLAVISDQSCVHLSVTCGALSSVTFGRAWIMPLGKKEMFLSLLYV